VPVTVKRRTVTGMALVDLYQGSVQSFVDRVAQIRADQWEAPTPCADWDVRTLVNHVVSEELWSVPLFEGATIAEVGDRFDGDLLGDDPTGRAMAAGGDAQAAVDKPDSLARMVHLSFGDTPADEYVYQLFADHLVHGWDLAVAIGADRTIDPEAVAACLTWFADREDAYRSAGAIGPRVNLPASATDQDRLIAAFGRDPSAS
jgi:uncharacterized protein (TIGR03086 family)